MSVRQKKSLTVSQAIVDRQSSEPLVFGPIPVLVVLVPIIAALLGSRLLCPRGTLLPVA